MRLENSKTDAFGHSIRFPRLGVTIICFSATASFSAGIVLLAIGTITVRRAQVPAELPYAVIPVIFGAQQLIEGSLWLSLPVQAAAAHMLTVAYLLLSNVLWPILVPFAVWMMEPIQKHRRRIMWTVAVGVAISMFFLTAIISHPVSASIKGMHIKYQLPHVHKEIAFAFYALATCLAPLLSSFKAVRLLGIVIIASMIGSYAFFAMWFASVWCFFAAALSCTVLLYFAGRRY